jgi:flagellar basal body rod protein FlgG
MAYTSAAMANRMSRARTDLRQVAHNLANANTPGFKKMMSYDSDGSGQGSPSLPGADGDLPQHISKLDLSTGEFRHTGRELDLALKKPADFFGVRTPDGLRYTRHGRFRVNADGIIVNQQGHPLAAQGGDLRLPQGASDLTVSPTGEVRADGQQVGTIEVYMFEDPARLERAGQTLLRSAGEQPATSRDPSVLQGKVEEANVQPMRQLVRMMSASRSYENSTRMLRRMGALKRKMIDQMV